MRALAVALVLVAAALPAWAQSPRVAEAQAVLDEKTPSTPADWVVKDLPQAKALLGKIKDCS